MFARICRVSTPARRFDTSANTERPPERKVRWPSLESLLPSRLSHTVAPRAVVPSGVEVLTLARGIGLGFVTAPQEGMAVEVDPTSLNAATSARVHIEDTIRRLVPDEVNGKLVALAETGATTDKLAGRHPVAGATQDDPGIDIGVSDGSLAWQQPVDGGADTAPVGIAVDGGGNALIAGNYRDSSGDDGEFWFARRSSEGLPIDVKDRHYGRGALHGVS